MRRHGIRAVLRVAIAGLALALQISACGDGEETDISTNDAAEAAVRSAITRVVTTDDPANCVRLQTEALIQDLYKGSVRKCRREMERQKPARSVRITELKVTGDTARARIVPSGGANDGQDLALDLARSDGHWKVDEVRYFYGSDPKADRQLDAALGSLVGQGVRQGFGIPVTRCAQRRLRVAFRSAGAPFGQRELLEEAKAITFGCLRDHPSSAPGLTSAFFKGLRQGAQKALGSRTAACVIDRLRQTIRPEEIIEALSSGKQPASMKRKEKAAATECGESAAILKALGARATS